MKEMRNLSGIYFRFKNPETNSFENRCFEDLPKEEQEKIIDGRIKEENTEWVKNLVIMLADRLNEIGDKFDIFKQ
jgi:hypothetical protein